MPRKTPLPSLSDCFADLDDPRVERGKRHHLIDIVTLAVCGIISGADNWVEIEEFGNAKIEWFRQFMELPNGIPSHDTFGTVFARICPKQFKQCFVSWVRAVFEVTQGQFIAIDGKRLRRSHDQSAGKAAIHMVSAWACSNRLVLGQVKTDAKSNEITAIPHVLRLLELAGCIVTIDAMGCQTAIAEQIVDQGGDYVFALKGNQTALHDAVQALFADPELANDPDIPVYTHETTDGDHGRVEVRRYRCVANPDGIDQEKSSQRGTQTKRRRAGWDDAYRLKVLTG